VQQVLEIAMLLPRGNGISTRVILRNVLYVQGAWSFIQNTSSRLPTVLWEGYENFPEVMNDEFGHFSSAYGGRN
jgi:hypothetical protein